MNAAHGTDATTGSVIALCAFGRCVNCVMRLLRTFLAFIAFYVAYIIAFVAYVASALELIVGTWSINLECATSIKSLIFKFSVRLHREAVKTESGIGLVSCLLLIMQ